ncbi:hypothetical protein ABEG18_05070 [Alsobacter sp. KACC 23698]|uniref:VanZ family protein n=1 Tax=Alsobacter sp. KACC 23698 TaxID=3149229 RepID=A0AAU7JID5_9HYPH
MPSIRFSRIAAWLLVVAIGLMTVCPIGLRPVTGLSVDLERFAAFGLLGLLFGLAYPRRRIAVLAAVVAAAAGLEAMQYLEPTRHGRVHDFEIKAVAGALGALSAMLFGKVAREANWRRSAG